jgi:hypothetical protein
MCVGVSSLEEAAERHHATPRITTHHHATPCNAMQRHATPCNAMQRHATPCNAMQHHGPFWLYMRVLMTSKGLLTTVTWSRGEGGGG